MSEAKFDPLDAGDVHDLMQRVLRPVDAMYTSLRIVGLAAGNNGLVKRLDEDQKQWLKDYNLLCHAYVSNMDKVNHD